MKKIISLLLLAAFLLCPLVSCAQEGDELYTIESTGLTYTLYGTNGTPNQIVVSKDGNVRFRQSVKVDPLLGNLDGCYGFSVTDLNFDGVKDIMIATKKEGDLVYQQCYLATNAQGDFIPSADLSALRTIGVSAGLEAIFGFEQTHEAVGSEHYEHCDKATKYVWKNGTLTPEIEVSITYYSMQALYCYSVAYYNEKTQKFDASTDRWLTPAEYEATDMSFLYYFKK